MTLQQQITKLQAELNKSLQQLPAENQPELNTTKYQVETILMARDEEDNPKEKGWGWGYIAIDKTHPLFGVDDWNTQFWYYDEEDKTIGHSVFGFLVSKLLKIEYNFGLSISYSGSSEDLKSRYAKCNINMEDKWFFGIDYTVFSAQPDHENWTKNNNKEYVEKELNKIANFLANWDRPNKYALSTLGLDKWAKDIIGYYDTLEEAILEMEKYPYCTLTKI